MLKPSALKMIKDFAVLVDEKKIMLEQEIDDDALQTVRFGLYMFKDSEATIVLNSVGGDVIAGMAIIDLIQSHPHPVHICVSGLAASMGCVIVQGATGKRLAYKNAVLMHHVGSMEISASHFSNVKRLVMFNEAYGERANKIMLNRVNEKRAKDNQPPRAMAWWKERDALDQWMNADEALELGFLDEII